MRHLRITLVVATALLLPALPCLAAGASAAGAAPASTAVLASFEGGTIDLANGWGNAHACIVQSPTTAECFATRAQLAAAAASLGVIPDTSCGSGALELFQDTDYGGNELLIPSPYNQWIDLDGYDFGDQTKSWSNTLSCGAYATKSDNGTGTELSMPAKSESASMPSGWADAINAVEIVS